MTKIFIDKKKKYLLGITIFIILLIILTYNDLRIAQWIYHPDSQFGRFFELVGTLPVPIIGIFSCVALITTAQKKICINTILSYLISLSLFKIGFSAYQIHTYIIPMLAGTVIWTIVSIFITLKIVNDGYRDSLRQAAIISIVAVFVSLFGVSKIKEFVSRERFYHLKNLDEFTYWYQIQPVKIQDPSFPSGHSAQSALTFCFLFIPNFVKKFDTPFWHITISIFAFMFTFCVMISRLILGAHYATDVLIGATISIITIVTTYKITNKYKKLTYFR